MEQIENILNRNEEDKKEKERAQIDIYQRVLKSTEHCIYQIESEEQDKYKSD